MAPRKNIDEGQFLRIYGPYPDKRDKGKWTVHIFPKGAKKAIVVPTFGFDLTPVNAVIQKELFNSLIERAQQAKEAEKTEE